MDPTLQGMGPDHRHPLDPHSWGDPRRPPQHARLGGFLRHYPHCCIERGPAKFSFYVRHHGSRLEPQLSACYADDLHLVSPSREATFKSNCIISAFAAIFGIEFASTKLWAITTISLPGEVVLYSREWVPIVVPFGKAAAYITSLGITYNLNRGTASIFQSLCVKLRNIATVLGGRQASTMARPRHCPECRHAPSDPYTHSLQFYCLAEKQHNHLASLLLKPPALGCKGGRYQAAFCGADETPPRGLYE
jgi:hypothetical protein